MKIDELTTETPNVLTRGIDRLETVELLRLINAEDQRVASAVAEQIQQVAKAVDVVTSRLERGGHLFYIGAGTSGRLGVLDASECAPTYNVPPATVQGIIAGGVSALSRATEASEDDPDSGVRDLVSSGLRPDDVLFGIAASGRTPYVLGAVAHANGMGALTIGLSCVAGSELSAVVKIPIEVITGPEVITGSTRMKAGTATKLVLNMISTGVMIRLGHTYGNLMVNVQPKNQKLVDRARRIIATAGRVDGERAAELLETSGRSVRTAIVMARLGLSREAAELKLRDAGYVIARALGEI